MRSSASIREASRRLILRVEEVTRRPTHSVAEGLKCTPQLESLVTPTFTYLSFSFELEF